MKKIVLLVFIVCNLFAIGGMDTLDVDERKVAKVIKNSLNISKKDAFELYTTYLHHYHYNKWQIYYNDNDDAKISKLDNVKNKTLFISLINTSRIINFS